MQTFLPYPSFAQSAACLDWRRLGCQRKEAQQIILALENPSYGWQNHPAVKMWRGYERSLALYGVTVCGEWRNRGYNDNLLTFFLDKYLDGERREDIYPEWIGNEAFHRSHRANLLRKDPVWYGKYWTEDITLPYIWPV